MSLAVAPAPGSVNIPLKWIAAGFVVFVAVLWIALTNTFSPPKPVVITATPAKTEAAPAPPPAPAAGTLLMCPTEAYKTKGGLIICGVTMVDQQYVWIQQGWIASMGNMSAAFTLLGDTSSCQFQISANRLVVNCKNPIAVSK